MYVTEFKLEGRPLGIQAPCPGREIVLDLALALQLLQHLDDAMRCREMQALRDALVDHLHQLDRSPVRYSLRRRALLRLGGITVQFAELQYPQHFILPLLSVFDILDDLGRGVSDHCTVTRICASRHGPLHLVQARNILVQILEDRGAVSQNVF